MSEDRAALRAALKQIARLRPWIDTFNLPFGVRLAFYPPPTTTDDHLMRNADQLAG
ncbi:MAG: hypothetical protein M1309_02750 [Actinobacteria bacterium]|nr:hypothetical protein [Actinomycetota bacterium]